MNDFFSPAMRVILIAIRDSSPLDARSWRSIDALKHRGFIARACCHPRSCPTCGVKGWACGVHIVGTSGHERCSGQRRVLTEAGRAALDGQVQS